MGRDFPDGAREGSQQIADRMGQNLAMLAAAETWDNGRPIRESTFANLPLAVDQFRHFASCIVRRKVASARSIPSHLPIISTNQSA